MTATDIVDCVSPEPDPEGGFTSPIGELSYAADIAYVEQLVAGNALLQATTWEPYPLNGRVWIQVQGGWYAGHVWHLAIGGRVFPSSTRAGVRRQMIIGPRISAEIIGTVAEAGDPR